PPGAPIRHALHAWLARHGLPLPPTVFESASVLADITWVRGSDAVAILPAGAAAHYAPLGLVRILPLSLDIPQPPVALIRPRRAGTSAAAAFFRALRAAAAEAG